VTKPANKFSASAKTAVIASILAVCVLASGYSRINNPGEPEPTAAALPTLQTETTAAAETEPAPPPETEPVQPVETAPAHQWETGYLAGRRPDSAYCDGEGMILGTLPRGTEVKYEITPDGKYTILSGDTVAYLQAGATVVSDPANIIPAHTLYVRTAVNLRDAGGRLLEAFTEKGTAVQVTGYDYLHDDGSVHMYRVDYDGAQGYIMPWYLADSEAAALENYDDGNYALHADRGNSYGGGDAGELDYFPREKGPIPGNEMPKECRTLYIASWQLYQLDAYLEIADNSGINAFVVDILDGDVFGYAGDVAWEYCPTGAASAINSVAEYQEAIQKLRDAGYYVIGRICTFNDFYLAQDHPEYAITDLYGEPLLLAEEYWVTPFNRNVWQYKVDLALEAAALMGFHEIQFDYVRFPSSTWSYESAGTIHYHNTLGESKAQAIQRFLMYAADRLREHGVYISADVFGESAYTYVTAYGQYWPAISNVVDVISGMPYPDHFGAEGKWLPWEHPYETLYDWGRCVVYRQEETATPAAVRTWIQAYDAIREPYNEYGPEEVYAQIRGLRDAGCTGGFMTWNAGSYVTRYTWLMPAFAPAS